jgi:hypothetical protein
VRCEPETLPRGELASPLRFLGGPLDDPAQPPRVDRIALRRFAVIPLVLKVTLDARRLLTSALTATSGDSSRAEIRALHAKTTSVPTAPAVRISLPRSCALE